MINIETYSYRSDAIIEVDGTKISTEVFKWFADAANVGSKFRFTKLADDVVTIETVSNL